MKNPEKYPESFFKTVKRTIITTTVIAVVITLSGIFPTGGKSKFALFGMIWLIAFCIVFGGHWLELVFINYLKFVLPKHILLLYFARIIYWFLCSVPLFIIANAAANLFSHTTQHLGRWWAFGLIYIGIQLFMHSIMQIRSGKSFYNGVY